MSFPGNPEDAPTYLSGHMADVVLSEFRPTRIKPDALRCVNVLLDELLWCIVKSARSVNTERLKSDGILRVVPASLGKEAILEAEMELREYWKNSGESRDAYRDMKENPATFPTQQVFEVIRLKCEADSSLGGAEDDESIAVTEAQDRLFALGPNIAPPIEAIAPASLYITAILEHVCGHIMSCVSRVVARDSSKTSASIQDVYNALCEDQSLYNMAKGMSSFAHIEAQARLSRVQRKGSISGSLNSARRAAAPSPRPPYEPPSASPTSASRDSAESSGQSVAPAAAALTRSPTDRSKASRTPKSSLGAKQSPEAVAAVAGAGAGAGARSSPVPENGAAHRRSGSAMSDGTKRAMAAFQEEQNPPTADDGEGEEFEELMRTGSTMKVSLTPDRLRTFEVFAKDRKARTGTPQATPTIPEVPTPQPATPPVPPLPTSLPGSPQFLGSPVVISPPRVAHRSSSPTNDGYSTDSAVGRVSASRSAAARTRFDALGLPPEPPVEPNGILTPPSSWTRARSSTESRPTPPRAIHFLETGSRKASMGNLPVISQFPEDMDDTDATPRKGSLAPRAPRVSQSARDLISFLDEGPPEDSLPPMARSGSTSGLDAIASPTSKRGGRFTSMVSRFTKTTPTQKQVGAGIRPNGDEFAVRNGPRRQRSAHTLGSYASTTTLGTLMPMPPSPVKPVPPRIPLHEKDSIPGLGAAYRYGATSLLKSSTSSKSDNEGAVKSQDGTPMTIPPTPPTSTESPPQAKALRDITPVSTPPPTVTDKSRATRARGLATPSATSPAEEYTQASHGLHARIAQDKVNETPIGATAPAENGVLAGKAPPAEDQLRLLQKMVSTASNMEECRLLVDGFLAQRGLHVEDTPPSVPPKPAAQQVDDDAQRNVIDWLMGGDGGTGLTASPPQQNAKHARSRPRERATSGLSPRDRPARAENGYSRKKSTERGEVRAK